jgi:hypothetical protein
VRIAGWVLLVGGFLLCVSVTWAALGFLLMGVGLISLLVAERNRNRAKLALASRAERLAAPPEISAGPPGAAQVPTGTATLRPNRAEPSYDRADPSYDKEAWRRLVESDSDLLRVTSVLQEYGQPYVDELARAYLAAGDSRRLPAIVDAIIRTAKRNFAKTNAAPLVSVAPDVDRSSRMSDRPPRQASYRTDPRYQPIPAPAPTVAVAPPPMPVEPVDGTEEVRPVGAPAVGAPIAETFVDPPAPTAGPRNTTITSADDDLTEMIGKFAPDSSFLRKD